MPSDSENKRDEEIKYLILERNIFNFFKEHFKEIFFKGLNLRMISFQFRGR